MTDKDILLSALKDISEILNNNGYGGWCATIRKAIALLKKQEEEIENLKQTAQSMMEGVCLLKEQEAVKPIWSCGKPFCGACGLRIHGGNFCSKCGKPIAWEGR